MIALKYLPLAIPAMLAASAGVSLVSGWLPLQGRSNDLTDFSQGSGVHQWQIDRLKYYATAQDCRPDGCLLSVNQSSGAILSLLGGAAQFDELRNIYPIAGDGEGVREPAKIVVYFRSDGDEPARAYQIWIPTHDRLQTPRRQPIAGSLLHPESSILPAGMDQETYQRKRRAEYYRDWGSN